VVWWVAGKTTVIVYSLRLRLGVGSFSTEAEFVAQYVGLVQFAIGLLAGWLISRYHKERAAIWVWALPTAYLLFAVALWRNPSASVLSPTRSFDGIRYYFLVPCSASSQITLDCAKKIFVRGMFYCSVSYSLGALLEAKRVLQRFARMGPS
jgi:hypothetical protein